MRLLTKIGLATAMGIGLSLPAQAYVDPNAGGLAFQLLTPLVALAAAGLAFARRQLGRIWGFLLGELRALSARLFKQ